MSLLEQFDDAIYALVEEFSGTELTKAEAIGVLEMAKARIVKSAMDIEYGASDE
jgi:hypothetical protein